MPKKEKEEVEETQEEEIKDELPSLAGLLPQLDRPEMRSMALFGEIDEERSSEVCVSLLVLGQRNKDDEEMEPIEFYLSTYGGNADDMFAIYDVMNVIKKKCEVHTYGIGKVMSAGVLLLANGTAGKRKV